MSDQLPQTAIQEIYTRAGLEALLRLLMTAGHGGHAGRLGPPLNHSECDACQLVIGLDASRGRWLETHLSYAINQLAPHIEKIR